MTLPSFEECFDKAKAGTATNLEKFIANFEPERDADAEVFREQLAAIIEPRLIRRPDDEKIEINRGVFPRCFWSPSRGGYEFLP